MTGCLSVRNESDRLFMKRNLCRDYNDSDFSGLGGRSELYAPSS